MIDVIEVNHSIFEKKGITYREVNETQNFGYFKEKSKLDWESFKDHEGIHQELQNYNKDGSVHYILVISSPKKNYPNLEVKWGLHTKNVAHSTATCFGFHDSYWLHLGVLLVYPGQDANSSQGTLARFPFFTFPK